MTTRPRSSRSSKAKIATKKAGPRKKARAGYHHGNLREVLIEATLALVEEGGPEAVTVREAARRAGVSPGAPFRHFPTRTSLMTAVAEEATHRLHDAVFAAVSSSEADDPLAALRAMGRAYLRWAYANPTHFAVVSDRRLIDYDSSQSIVRENREMQALMVRLVIEARKRGLARRYRSRRGATGQPRPRLRPGAHAGRRAPAAMGRAGRALNRSRRSRDRPFHRWPHARRPASSVRAAAPSAAIWALS